MTQVSVAQDGISKLLAAEQEAQQIVTKARKGTFVDHQPKQKRFFITAAPPPYKFQFRTPAMVNSETNFRTVFPALSTS